MTIVKVEIINGPMSLELFLNKIGIENVVQILPASVSHNMPIYTVIYRGR